MPQKNRMRLHIPDDWDGVSWDCCPLFFPDSPQWRSIMRGHIESLRRGWGWDEQTGALLPVLDTSKLIALSFMPSDEIAQLPEVQNIMGCFTAMLERLDTVIGHVDEVEDLLRELQAVTNTQMIQCCGDMSVTGDVVPDYSPIDWDNPPPSPTWGDNPVSSEQEFNAHICAYAHAWVDMLIGQSQDVQDAIDKSILAIAIIAAILGLLSGAGILLAIKYTAAAGSVSALLKLIGTQVMGQAAVDIETNRDDIVCAITKGHSPASAVAVAVSPAAWNAFYRWINYSNLLNTIWSGGANGQALPVIIDNRPCDCDPPVQLTYARISQGVYIGDYYYEDGTIPGDTASYVNIQFFADPQFTIKKYVAVTISNDSAYGLRLPPERAYRLRNEHGTVTYANNTVYPAGLSAHSINVKHIGQSSKWTVKVEWAEL